MDLKYKFGKYHIQRPVHAYLNMEAEMSTKHAGMSLTLIGLISIVGSAISLNYSDMAKWFPVLLIAGGAAMWSGVNKYRWAR